MKHFFLFSFCFLSLHAMSLEETVSYALEHNNALKQTDLNVKQLQSKRDAKQLENFGRFDVIASYDHYNLSRTLSPLTPMSIVGSPDGAYTIPTTQNLFTAGVSYNVILFNGFAQKNSYKISDLQYKNSSIKSKLGREELIYNVRNLYISLLTLQEQRAAQKLLILSQEKLVADIQTKYELGSKSKLDLLYASNSLEDFKSQEISMSANIDILKASLSALMGGHNFDKSETIAIDMNQNTYSRTTSDIKSLDRYKASELDIKASTKRYELSKASFYPVIDFGVYYGQNFGPNDTSNTVPLTSSAPTAGETLIQEGNWNSEEIWQLGLHLKWNILDFGVSSSKIQESKIALIQAKLESDNVSQELQKNISIAKSKINLALSQYTSAKSQYALLQETQKMEKILYENAALTLTDLLQTQAKENIAHAAMINAKYTYQKAKYYLDYLLEKGEKR